jgi:hypothetical protein
MVLNMTKLDNWPHILQWHCHLGTLLWSDSSPLHWTFKWGQNCPWLLWLLPTLQCTANTAHVSMTLLHDVFRERIISKDIWPPWSPDPAPPDYYVGRNERHSLQRQSTHSLNWRKPSQISPRCLSMSIWRPFPTFIVAYVSMRNVFVLIYRDSLNISIVCSRYTGTCVAHPVFPAHCDPFKWKTSQMLSL